MKDRPRWEILDDPVARDQLVHDLYGELTDEVFERSALGSLLLDVRPDIVIDSINTAGALAYQNFFNSAMELLDKAREGWRRPPAKWKSTWPPATCPSSSVIPRSPCGA